MLTFSEAIDPIEPALRVVDADGNEVDLGTADQSRGSDTLGLDIEFPFPVDASERDSCRSRGRRCVRLGGARWAESMDG